MQIGPHLKELRKKHQLSLRDLAARAECSPSFLSQIELDQTSPSVSSLSRISRALGMTLADFFQSEVPDLDALVMQESDPREILTRWPTAQLQYILPSTATHNFSALRLVLQPGGKSGMRASRRTMKELGIVMRGDGVEFLLGRKRQKLSTGASVYFDLYTPHQWHNQGKTEAVILLVNSNFTEVFDLDQQSVGPDQP